MPSTPHRAAGSISPSLARWCSSGLPDGSEKFSQPAFPWKKLIVDQLLDVILQSRRQRNFAPAKRGRQWNFGTHFRLVYLSWKSDFNN
jgi:hypothetical protein